MGNLTLKTFPPVGVCNPDRTDHVGPLDLHGLGVTRLPGPKGRRRQDPKRSGLALRGGQNRLEQWGRG